MTDLAIRRQLERAKARIRILESLIETRTRELFLTNQRLSAKNRHLEELNRVMPSALLVADAAGHICEANPAATNLLGFPTGGLDGRPLRDVWADAPVPDDLRSEESEEQIGVEATWLGEGGVELPVLASITAHAGATEDSMQMVILGVDLRERRRMEIELRHAQKLESVGQLAAGVAHEINTPMQFIGDNVHFLQEVFQDMWAVIEAYQALRGELPADAAPARAWATVDEAEDIADLEDLVERIPGSFARTIEGIERVSTIVSALKSFSHPGADRTLVDVNRAIRTTLEVAKNEYKYVADIEAELGDIPSVLGYEGDLNQVLLNLVVNAAHAVEEKNRGTEARGLIRIETTETEDRVRVAVRDTGCGIPESIRHRIFDPFFTTKQVGKGTGQGLSLVHSIVVDKHGGQLELESELGSGTSFFIYLPRGDGAEVRW